MVLIIVWHFERSAMKKYIKLFILLFIFSISILIPIKGECSVSMFTDVSVKEWYFDPIINLYSLSIVDGYPDNSFKPQGDVKMDEFIKMTVKALGFDTANSTGYWAQSYIDQADKINLLEGLIDFEYTEPLNRAQAAIIISNSLEYVNEPLPQETYFYPFDLGSYTPVEYLDQIKKCYSAGIINGFEDGTYRYRENITRAQACTLITKLIDAKKRDCSTRLDYSFINPDNPISIKYVNTNYQELSDTMKSTLNEIKDSVGYTVVEKKIYETKTTYEIRYHKSSVYSNPTYCMFAFRFFEGDTGYPETQWGYDTMFLKVELKSLDWEDGIPVAFYKSKVKNALCAALKNDNPQIIADYMMTKYNFLRALKPPQAYDILEDNENDTLRYVFFTMQNVIGNFTFSDR